MNQSKFIRYFALIFLLFLSFQSLFGQKKITYSLYPEAGFNFGVVTNPNYYYPFMRIPDSLKEKCKLKNEPTLSYFAGFNNRFFYKNKFVLGMGIYLNSQNTHRTNQTFDTTCFTNYRTPPGAAYTPPGYSPTGMYIPIVLKSVNYYNYNLNFSFIFGYKFKKFLFEGGFDYLFIQLPSFDFYHIWQGPILLRCSYEIEYKKIIFLPFIQLKPDGNYLYIYTGISIKLL